MAAFKKTLKNRHIRVGCWVISLVIKHVMPKGFRDKVIICNLVTAGVIRAEIDP